MLSEIETDNYVV